MLKHRLVNTLVPLDEAVHPLAPPTVVGSVAYAKVFVPVPPATQMFNVGEYANVYTDELIIVFPNPVQVFPSGEYANVFVPPPPPASHTFNVEEYTIANTLPLKEVFPNPVNVFPSVEYSNVFVPTPPITINRLELTGTIA